MQGTVVLPRRLDEILHAMQAQTSPDEPDFLGFGISTLDRDVYALHYQAFVPSWFLLSDLPAPASAADDPYARFDRSYARAATSLRIMENLRRLTQVDKTVKIFQVQTIPLDDLDELRSVQMPSTPELETFSPGHYLFLTPNGSTRPFMYLRDDEQLLPLSLLVADGRLSHHDLMRRMMLYSDYLYANLPPI